MYLKNISIRHTEQSEVSINISKLPKNGSFTSFRMTMKSRRKNVCLRNTSVRHTEQSEVSINTYELSGNGFFTSFRMTMKSRRNFFTSLRMDVDL